jgi:hypothetical protein
MVYYIPKIYGGLCNQLFQIFSVMGMAKRDNVDFGLINNLIDQTMVKFHSGKKTFFNDFLIKLKPFFIDNIKDYHHITENNSNFLINNKNIVFDGYFQDYKLLKFLGNDLIKGYLNFPEKDLSKYNLDNAFYIHFRRGDYVGNAFHSVLNDNYYSEAIKEYPEDATILISSNEKNYGLSKGFLENRNVIFIDESEVTTLEIMSKCRWGGICANSSFSWWGSYLNESPDKIICMPFRWFNSTDINIDKYYYPGVKKIVYN